jgi:hypothetical protein
LRRSRGDFTVAELGQIGDGDSPVDACSNQYSTTHNYCTKAPATTGDSKADGAVAFIRVDYDSGSLLPMD